MVYMQFLPNLGKFGHFYKKLFKKVIWNSLFKKSCLDQNSCFKQLFIKHHNQLFDQSKQLKSSQKALFSQKAIATKHPYKNACKGEVSYSMSPSPAKEGCRLGRVVILLLCYLLMFPNVFPTSPNLHYAVSYPLNQGFKMRFRSLNVKIALVRHSCSMQWQKSGSADSKLLSDVAIPLRNGQILDPYPV